MFFKILYKISLILLLFSISLYPQNIVCKNPAIASTNLVETFKYGCFCGKDYPNIKHPSKKNYRDLNNTQRQELILKYEEIEAYDDIDEACKQHDICYIKKAKKAKSCNELIITRLDDIEKSFKKYDLDNLKNRQCKHLAYDIRSVFNTMFAPADDEDTIFDFGMLVFNTGITIANKSIQESVDTLGSHPPRYPAKGEKCLFLK